MQVVLVLCRRLASFSWSHESCVSSLWSMSVRRRDFSPFLHGVLYVVLTFIVLLCVGGALVCESQSSLSEVL